MRKDGTTLRVLIVDDEPLSLWGLSRFLENRAVDKTIATDEEAFDEIGEQHYDLCFLDAIQSGMTVLEAMKIMNERSPIRVIINFCFSSLPLHRSISHY
jgi:CheY-like chemotaxis protein